MKRFSIAALFVGLILLVALAPTTMTVNNNTTSAGTLTSTAAVVMMSSPNFERAGPAVNLTNGGTFTYTSPVQTAITLGTYLDQHQSNLLQANMDAGMTVTANRFNDMSTTITTLVTTLTNKASPVVIDATQGANLTNDPATINKASPVSNSVSSSNSTSTVVLNCSLTYMPSTTIRDMGIGDNNVLLTSVSARGNVHRMTATRIALAVNMMSTSTAGNRAEIWSLHRQTPASTSIDSRDANNMGTSFSNTTFSLTINVNGATVAVTINGVMT